MFDRLLPQPIDNTYRGYKVALWLFGSVVGVMIFQGVLVIFNGDSIVRNADGIPLDTYTPAAAQAVLSLWAQRGLSRLIISSVCVLVLVRYRSAIPLMFVLLMLNYLAGQLVFQFVPLARTGTPPGPVVNLIMFALMVIGFVLSLRRRSMHT
jgi:hypothetical protein